MTDQEKDKNPPENPKPEGPDSAIQKGTLPVALPTELVDAFRQEQQTVDVNVVLVSISQKAKQPDDLVAQAERVLELAARMERQRTENWERRMNAIIDAKERDPDERDKRANNETRRVLKRTISGTSVIALMGGVGVAAFQGSFLVSCLLLALSTVSISLSAMLASGESVSSNDVVRVINAMRNIVSPPSNQGRQGKQRRKP